jgi:hypothetical protein
LQNSSNSSCPRFAASMREYPDLTFASPSMALKCSSMPSSRASAAAAAAEPPLPQPRP